MCDMDRVRFIDCMYEFNDEKPALNWREKTPTPKSPEVEPREKLVEILAYCLMPNHYHFMLRQIRNNGISRFMKKLGTGYTIYFNKKYERNGALFQGRFKSIPVDRDEYLRYLPHYIHLNPIELRAVNWQTYRWSSYRDFIDQAASSLLNINSIKELYEPAGYKAACEEWISNRQAQEQLASVALD